MVAILRPKAKAARKAAKAPRTQRKANQEKAFLCVLSGLF
jgi:hypothetical protein